MTSETREALLAGVSRSQHGVFRRAQAIEAGFPPSTIDDLVRRGVWTRVGRGVLAPAGSPVTYRRAATAAVLSYDSGVASHECAATLLGFRYLDTHPIVVTVPLSSWNRLEGVITHRSGDLIDEHITTVHGVPATTAARTVVDLAAVLLPGRLEMVLDSVLGTGLVEMPGLIRAFNQVARKGRKGVGRIRPMIAARGEGFVAPDSELERRFRAFIKRCGLPAPAAQLPTWWEGRLIGLADFAYPHAQLIIELDGRLGHTQLLDREHDNLRDQLAVAAGWRVVRITWRQLHRHPDQVLELLGSALLRGAA